MRPLGGWVFGRLADTRGRRAALILSVVLMCGGSLLIAISPSYASVGIAAHRHSTDRAHGAGPLGRRRVRHQPTYMSEMAVAGHRGFYASFQYVTLIGGQLLAIFVMVSLQAVLSSQQMVKWGLAYRLRSVPRQPWWR